MYAALTYAPTYTYSCVHRHLLTPSLLVKKKKSLKIFSYHPSLAHAHKNKKKKYPAFAMSMELPYASVLFLEASMANSADSRSIKLTKASPILFASTCTLENGCSVPGIDE